jgi:hypothetical protein
VDLQSAHSVYEHDLLIIGVSLLLNLVEKNPEARVRLAFTKLDWYLGVVF